MGGDGEEREVKGGEGRAESEVATAPARADREASSWWLSVAGGRQGGRGTRAGSNAGFVFLFPVPLLTTD
jgi:hypothetical protein